MTRPLFEQYKDALRRGHVASRSGQLDDALTAYAEAARLAPDRAAPHTSSATVLHRAGRHDAALAAFEKALAIAADDEATLRARAVTFEDLGRPASAAADLEYLAEALDADGRRAEALAAARRAVELTATPARRALVERLQLPEDESAPRPRPSPTARAAAAAPTKPAPRPAPAPASRVEAPAGSSEAARVAPELTAGQQSSSLLMDLYDEPVQAESAAPEAAEAAPEAVPARELEATPDLDAKAAIGPGAAQEPVAANPSPQRRRQSQPRRSTMPRRPREALPNRCRHSSGNRPATTSAASARRSSSSSSRTCRAGSPFRGRPSICHRHRRRRSSARHPIPTS